MSLQIPFKLLEINVISAQDLAPVSKQLRTYVVAWIHPEDKLTTRTDHHGHTNPTWNYKLLFRVDDNQLYSDTSSITIEIYNMAWLRDTPVGTTNVLIKHLIPSSSTRSSRKDPPVPHLFALQISRPSGQVQGILNLAVKLVDTTTLSMPLSSELSVSTVRYRDQISSIGNDNYMQENANSEVMVPVLHRSQSARTTQSSVHGGSISNSIRPKDLAKSGSLCSYMHPIPSEVAAALKEEGLYSIAGDDFGSSIFENWTEGGDLIRSPHSEGMKSKSLTWKSDDPLITRKKEDEKRRIHRRSYSEGAGLFSCFGNAYGFEFTFSCGSKSAKKHKKRLLAKSNINNIPTVRSDESLRNGASSAASKIDRDGSRFFIPGVTLPPLGEGMLQNARETGTSKVADEFGYHKIQGVGYWPLSAKLEKHQNDFYELKVDYNRMLARAERAEREFVSLGAALEVERKGRKEAKKFAKLEHEGQEKASNSIK
ncbi:hypothetical protein LguiA_016583 [Lonicera macranthoides]